MAEPDHDGRRDMQEAVRRRAERRATWEKEGERPLWKNMSMIGALGWLIVMPTLLGVFAGRWLDGMLGTGVTFSGALTFVGAGLGFYLAWKRMNQE
ncbi:AtpZ/AtpI family protein [Rhodovulum marinum]|uniref:ATP synthase protein I n=1 Tax=Rhodovulum marinum TaxID=320662 RepID=A0A4R2PVE5_9RHOB|nr:AtpZ/AtpI family protein [Rhodovulum marinum]TCP39970.1 ATP synthase protein I [Rhodovulum marinum]